MKITNVKVHILKPAGPFIRLRENKPPQQWQFNVVQVITDEGIDGAVFAWYGRARILAEAVMERKPLLIGMDPLDRELLAEAMNLHFGFPHAGSYLDMCLWDIAGKAAGVPVYKLLGAYRHKIRAFAATHWYPTIQHFVDLVLRAKEKGYTACKLGSFADVDKDIALCRAVRKAAGDSFDLMLDPFNRYDRQQALKLGRVLEELNFLWFEAPIPDDDIEGYVDLTRSLDMQIAGTEGILGGLRAYTPYVARGAVDPSREGRTVGDVMGGITTMKKVTTLCEAFGLKVAPHSFGPTTVQAAHLHVMLSAKNCDMVEVPFPEEPFDIGMNDLIRPDKDGFVHAPTKPGLGYEIDWDTVRELTTEIVE
ncbi:MAG: mandelate racemase/muconate lactonizing enzyme family protein [Dehalococcoidia bacterium]|nr:mandelate racemase/muconate lactonizing enzyme family protein [Dehalococcoidia bacterium]